MRTQTLVVEQKKPSDSVFRVRFLASKQSTNFDANRSAVMAKAIELEIWPDSVNRSLRA